MRDKKTYVIIGVPIEGHKKQISGVLGQSIRNSWKENLPTICVNLRNLRMNFYLRIDLRYSHIRPWSSMASTTLTKPAILAPLT